MAKGRAKKMVTAPRQTMGVGFSSDMKSGLANLDLAIREKVLRPTAYAGARVFYDELRRRVPVKTGKLYGAIYHWFDEKQSRETEKTYAIGPNKSKAPHWYVVEYGHWLYNRQANGRWLKSKSNKNARGPAAHDLPGARKPPKWVPAQPYVRTTFGAVSGAAVTAMKVRFSEKLTEAIREL